MRNIRNKIWQRSLAKENMRYLVWTKPEFIYIYVYMLYICYVTIGSPIQFLLSSLNGNWTQQKIFVKEVPHRPAQIERELQWFKTSFQLPDYSTSNSYCLIPKKGEWSYRRRAISNKQSNKTLHHSSSSTEQLKR